MARNRRTVEGLDAPCVVVRALPFPVGEGLDERFKIRQGGQRGFGRQAQLTSMANALRVNMGACPARVGIDTEASSGIVSVRPHRGHRQGPARECMVVRDTEHAGARQVQPHFVWLWRVVD